MLKSPEIRVTSGRFRGRKLQSPQSMLTHPMGAREKLALFNMVDVVGKRVLDAYAGSGALGIEALSRGATEAVFVEYNRSIAGVISQNLSALGLKGNIFVEKIANFAQRRESQGYFDVIIADPPYDKVDEGELEKLVNLMADDGILVLSSPAEREIILDGLDVVSSHTYARARLTVYSK